MSTTDTRPGFRLPWSSDRSRDDAQTAEPTDAVEDALAELPADAGAPVESDGSESAAEEDAWPAIDVGARLSRLSDGAGTTGSTMSRSARTQESSPMVDTAARPVAPTPTPKKPSKLIADLAAAMRSTAEIAREQAKAQVEADARQVVEDIRARSTEGAATLRQRSDDDIAKIREWSKAEIARVREETDRRISDRKAALEAEVAAHAAAIERRIEEVEQTVAAWETDMAGFFERLLQESDPAHLAAMAEAMPEPPSLAPWSEIDLDAVAAESAEAAQIEEAAEVEAGVEAAESAASEAEAEATAETADAAQASEAEVEAVAEVDVEAALRAEARSAWADSESGWGDVATATPASPNGEADVPRWGDAFATDDLAGEATAFTGDPVDRGSIMAALEAAAEAVVAAEAAADSADQAEAAAGVAETAAELLVGRVDVDEDADPEAEAALLARTAAGGFETEPSLADRLASLLPGGATVAADATPTTTQVVVTGLVSVASIASFKRHLSRLGGVQSVSVASGPEGEFVFNVTHRADTSLRDVIPTLPGFAARVVGTGEGVVNVSARDPETEG